MSSSTESGVRKKHANFLIAVVWIIYTCKILERDNSVSLNFYSFQQNVIIFKNKQFSGYCGCGINPYNYFMKV